MQQIAGLNVEHWRVVPWETPRAIFHISLSPATPPMHWQCSDVEFPQHAKEWLALSRPASRTLKP